MEDGGEDMELKYELWKESIFQEKVIYECRKRLSGYRRAVFCVIGNSLEFPIIQKKHPQKDAFCSLTTREIDVREKIRTPDTLVRSQVLYPAELHTHTFYS